MKHRASEIVTILSRERRTIACYPLIVPTSILCWISLSIAWVNCPTNVRKGKTSPKRNIIQILVQRQSNLVKNILQSLPHLEGFQSQASKKLSALRSKDVFYWPTLWKSSPKTEGDEGVCLIDESELLRAFANTERRTEQNYHSGPRPISPDFLSFDSFA